MYDIIFDFSSSPVGGALKRIEAYASFFSASDLRTVFLINKNVSHILDKYNGIRYECISKNIFQKIFGKNNYLNKYSGKTKWLFSYGIPVENPIGRYNWFHISNALPLAKFEVKIERKLKYRMMILYRKIRKSSINCTIVSGESKFSIDLYRKIDSNVDTIVLENSFKLNCNFSEDFLPINLKSKKFALIVGTATYKRLDLAYKIYLELREKYYLDYLVIIGDDSSVDKEIKMDKNIIFYNDLSDFQYLHILKNSEFFISTSEIENSSCAVLEAIFFNKTCYLSDIPSHRELLPKFTNPFLEKDGYFCISGDKYDAHFQSWDSIILKMLDKMKSIS